MSQNDNAFLRPDLNWAELQPSISNPQGGVLPAPRILQNGDVLGSERCADGTVISRFAVAAALWEPAAGSPGLANITDVQGNVLVSIAYNGTALPILQRFLPPLQSTNGIKVTAPTGTFRVWVQGFARYGG